MKNIILLLFSVMSLSVFAQIDTDSIPLEDLKDTKKAIKNSSGQVEDALRVFQDAQEEYEDAQKELNQVQEEEIQAQNQLESARVKLRQAKLAVNQARKNANPIVIERYEPNINPIYEEMSLGVQPGMALFIEGSETGGLFGAFSKNIDDEYKKYLKQYNAQKVKKRKGELFFDNMLIPEISSSNMDVYVDFVEQEGGVSLRSYFNTGAGFKDFNDPNASETRYLTRMLDQFARYIRTKNLETEIDSLEKEIDKTSKDLDNEKKDVSNARSDIQKAKQDIAESIGDISAKEGAIDDLNDKLEIMRQKLSNVN